MIRMALLTALFMVLSVVAHGAGVTYNGVQLDGGVRIGADPEPDIYLFIGDIQHDQYCSRWTPNEAECVTAILDRAKYTYNQGVALAGRTPDLIVTTGDQTEHNSLSERERFRDDFYLWMPTAVALERFRWVIGNHDTGSTCGQLHTFLTDPWELGTDEPSDTFWRYDGRHSSVLGIPTVLIHDYIAACVTEPAALCYGDTDAGTDCSVGGHDDCLYKCYNGLDHYAEFKEWYDYNQDVNDAWNNINVAFTVGHQPLCRDGTCAYTVNSFDAIENMRECSGADAGSLCGVGLNCPISGDLTNCDLPRSGYLTRDWFQNDAMQNRRPLQFWINGHRGSAAAQDIGDVDNTIIDAMGTTDYLNMTLTGPWLPPANSGGSIRHQGSVVRVWADGKWDRDLIDTPVSSPQITTSASQSAIAGVPSEITLEATSPDYGSLHWFCDSGCGGCIDWSTLSDPEDNPVLNWPYNTDGTHRDTVIAKLEVNCTENTYPVTVRASNLTAAADDTLVMSVEVSASVDTSPPTPDPATFASLTPNSENQVTLTATAGSDPSTPIQYQFICTTAADGCDDRTWDESNVHIDSGLVENTGYNYTIQMRDSVPNTGTASSPTLVTTIQDVTAPTGGEAWDTNPTTTGPNTITMAGNSGLTDAASLPVLYEFECSTADSWPGSGCPASGSRSADASNSFTASGLTASTEYFFRYRGTDSAGTPNATSYSTVLSDTTSAPLAGLGDLDVATSRIMDWQPATAAKAGYDAAQSWQEYDATCICNNGACLSPTGPGGAGCTAHSGTVPIPSSWSCPTPADPADNAVIEMDPPTGVADWIWENTVEAAEDWNQINCMIAAAPDNSVIFLRAGTYAMGNGGFQAIEIARSNVVLRGESAANTILQAVSTKFGRLTAKDTPKLERGVLYDTRACGDADCEAAVVSVGGSGLKGGTTTPWTGGYEEKATSLTVTSNAGMDTTGDWVLLDMTGCVALLPEQASRVEKLVHIAKVAQDAVGSTDIELDQGLMMDYDDDGCEVNAVAAPWTNIVTNIGIENLQITSHTSVDQLHIGTWTPTPLVGFGGVAESWLVGNHIHRGGKELTQFAFAARNWFFGNHFENFGSEASSYSHGINFQSGSVNNVVESNRWDNHRVASMQQGGASASILAYNYVDDGTPPLPNVSAVEVAGTDWSERSFFVHGAYTRSSLWEANDLRGTYIVSDRWWGRNGPFTTAFRNRLRGTINSPGHAEVEGGGAASDLDARHSSNISQLGIDVDQDNEIVVGSYANFIGNHAPYYYGGPLGCCGPNSSIFPVSLRESEGGGMSVDNFTSYYHFEKNVFRDEQTCSGDPTTGRCGFHMDTPQATTICGCVDQFSDAGDPQTTGTPDGLCDDGRASNVGVLCSADGGQTGANDEGDNWGGLVAPAAMSNSETDSIPNSLYRTSTPPDWWCSESCSWSDVYSSLGAWGDEFCEDKWDTGNPQTTCSMSPAPESGRDCADKLCDSDPTKTWGLSLCKLPAEIVLVDDGDCTCSGSYMRPDGSQWCGLGSLP